jgi:ABC-2 type transport system ATP-binding protein
MEGCMQLRIRDLSKTYRNGVQALKSVSLDVPAGLFGLLGPNGAGKSTLMRILATLQEPDAGSVHLDELDVLRQKDEVRQVLGYLPQDFGLYPKVSAERLLDHFAVLKGVADKAQRRRLVDTLFEQTRLEEVRRTHLGEFSGGMRQRFGVAVALLGNPKLLIVDEPTAGLDPEERIRFLNILAGLGEDAIVLLSTHIVADVAAVCSQVAIINRGEIRLTADPQTVAGTLERRLWQKVIAKRDLAAYTAAHRVISTRLHGGAFTIHVEGDAPPDGGFAPVTPDLEDVYLATVGAGRIA